MAYTKKDFTDGETPVSEENLDHMEDGIQQNSQDIDDIEDGTTQVENANNANFSDKIVLDVTDGITFSYDTSQNSGDAISVSYESIFVRTKIDINGDISLSDTKKGVKYANNEVAFEVNVNSSNDELTAMIYVDGEMYHLLSASNANASGTVEFILEGINIKR